MNLMPKSKKHCVNCGATYSIQEAKCPYCGSSNEIGAELKYLEHLEDIREDLEDIAEVPESVYKEEIKSTGKKIFKPILLVAIALTIITTVYLYFNNQALSSFNKEQLLRERETFPILDEWYEAGEYDKIQELFRKNEDYPVYEWKHYDFIISYGEYQSVMFYREFLKKGGELSKTEKGLLLYNCMYLIHDGTFQDSYKEFTEEEKLLIEEYGKAAKQLLSEETGMDETQIEEMYRGVSEDGYLDFDKCRKYVKEIDW